MKPVRLLWILLLLVAGWSTWWAIGAWNARSDLSGWMEARRDAGWQAEWSDISVTGYPTRIDRTITDLTLADTESGWVWNAPFFQILGLNYDKDHVVLVWPDRMTLQTPYERIGITGEELQGSMTFVPGRDRELDQATLVFRDLELSSDAGWRSSVDEARIATRPTEGREGTRDIALEITGLKPKSAAVARLSNLGLVPATFQRLNADLAVTFDKPWNRTALEGTPPQSRQIEIRKIGAEWGRLELRAAGDLSVADDGEVSGEVALKATNWKEMLQLLQETGAMPEGVVATIDAALDLLSAMTGRSDTLEIPLTFANGSTRIGIVPIGPAPVIRLP